MKIISIAIAVTLFTGIALAQENPVADDLLTAARANGSLNLFVTAAQSAGMAKMLKEEGPFTVFALSDRAFINLAKEDREALMAHPAAMHFLLARYIVRGSVAPGGRLDAERTLLGVKLRTDRHEGKWMVNGAALGRAEARCSNGMIYVLDRFDPGLVHDALQMARQ